VIYAATKGYLDRHPTNRVCRSGRSFVAFLHEKHPEISTAIAIPSALRRQRQSARRRHRGVQQVELRSWPMRMPSVRSSRPDQRSLKNTQQITKAMKQVAAAKIRRAERCRSRRAPTPTRSAQMLRDLMAASAPSTIRS
jgi:hypothetical protein